MIYLTFQLHVENFQFDAEDLMTAVKAAYTSIQKKPEFADLVQRTVFARGKNVTVQFEGVSAADRESIHYLSRLFSYEMKRLGFGDIGFLYGAGQQVRPHEKLININYFKPTPSVNSRLTAGTADDQIPENYKCALTYEIMDEPVHINLQPNIYFDSANLQYWLFRQENEFKHPITQQLITLDDIVIDDDLKNEIDTYARNQSRLNIENKRNLFLAKMAYYQAGQPISIENIDKAFRRAAAENDVEGMQVMIAKISNINAQDNNPQNKKTALHWAVKRGAQQAAAYLLKNGADPFVFDAQDKSVIDYAVENGTESIIKLINPGYVATLTNKNTL